MTIGEAVGVKKALGYGTSLIDVKAADYVGETVTVYDADGDEVAKKPVPETGRLKIPIEESGAITVTVGDEERRVVNVTAYGTYRVNFSKQIIYTLRVDTEDSNPLSRCEYLDDCEGFDRAHMDFMAGEFDYGSWKDAFFMPRPCMVTQAGEIDYYLDPDDYTKKEDGSNSDVGNLLYAGNAFMAFSTAYLRFTQVGQYYYISVSNRPGQGFNAYAHHDHAGNVMPYTFMPIYNGSLHDGKLGSKSGQAPYVNGTAANERSYAQANGDIYDIETFADRQLLIALALLIGKSTDAQETFGYGRCASGNANAIATGTMDKKGLFWGSNDQTSGVKVFGMENPWGNVWRRIVGLMASGAAVYVKLTYGTEDGSTATGFRTDTTGYISAGVTLGGTNGGFINKVAIREYGIIPQTASGSGTTYETDGLWFTTTGGTYMALVGGCWYNAALVGALCVYLSGAPSIASADAGASLSCKPPVAA